MRLGWKLVVSVALAFAGAEGRALAESASTAVYQVRGEVARPPEGAARKLWVRHEAIPDFVDASGAARPMQPMVMQFDVAPGIPLDDLRVGDKLDLRLAVSWSPPVMRVERLERLPAETQLRFTRTPTTTPGPTPTKKK